MSATQAATAPPQSQQMRYFRALVRMGHVGQGQEVTVARYIRARNALHAMEIAGHMPRVKSKGSLRGVVRVDAITEQEYLAGLESEAEDPYLVANGGTRQHYTGRG